MDYIRRGRFIFPLVLFWAAAAQALGPHEILVLVNDQSPASKQIAHQFAQLRHIPPQNVIALHLPDSVLEPAAEISPSDFSSTIWEPAWRIAKERGIADHILAWAYSADFPRRVTTNPKMSIQGITFTRGVVPGPEFIQGGTFKSPLFAGPDKPNGPQGESRSLEQFKQQMGNNMPMPSLMLGLTGSRGMDVETVIRNMTRSALADRTAPRGTVYFVANDNIRTHCRAWQYPGARRELIGLHVASTLGPDFPDGKTDAMGILVGTAWRDPAAIPVYPAGAIAENLTSFGGDLDNWDQTKLTDWIRAGVTASDGTVVEPGAIWTKFPNARIFAHYARGCTLLESYFQSVACPLQTLIAGDPLACPWARSFSVVTVRTDEGTNSDVAIFHSEVFPSAAAAGAFFIFLVDGRVAYQGPSPDASIDTKSLADGFHAFRVVVYLAGPVRQQAFADYGFSVKRNGREVRIGGIKQNAVVDHVHSLKLKLWASGKPAKVGVIGDETWLMEQPGCEQADLALSLKSLGLGPVCLQAAAIYSDGEVVRSAPVTIDIQALNHPPALRRITAATNVRGEVTLTAEATDPESDPITFSWFQILPISNPAWCNVLSGQFQPSGDVAVFKPAADNFDLAVFPDFQLASANEITVGVSVETDWPALKSQKAGLVFDFQSASSFRFFGLMGDTSGWTLGHCENGKLISDQARGAFIVPNKSYRIAVRKGIHGELECLVDNEPVIRLEKSDLGKGPVGLLAAGKPAKFTQPAISPPGFPLGRCRMEGPTLAMAPYQGALIGLIARASDGSTYSEMSYSLPPPR